MGKIRNINLEFSCPENISSFEKVKKGHHCQQCEKVVIDFTNKTDNEFEKFIPKSESSVCGIFKLSQLSKKFLKYAATSIIVGSSSLSIQGQEAIKKDSINQACDQSNIPFENDVVFGNIIETQAEPVGGIRKFYEELNKKIIYPKNLLQGGKVYIQFRVDTLGTMMDFKVARGFDPQADQAALDAISSFNFPFNPGKQSGKPIESQYIILITFEAKAK
jgi:protein TonB